MTCECHLKGLLCQKKDTEEKTYSVKIDWID